MACGGSNMETSNEGPSTSKLSENLFEKGQTDIEKPVCVIVMGMAGSGKTSFVQRIVADLYARKQPPYAINLDPATAKCPFPANVDIRDSVKYKEVMKQYNLGPNGAIMTSLNLFSSRFDQVMGLLEKRQHDCRYVIFDTPGQIEVFTWSASGTIITETLAATYPTVIVYILDSARSVNPVTFMSNMLYACSILYRTKLPFIVVLNKADIVAPTLATEWMRDFEAFHAALDEERSYSADLARSLSLVLDEFYNDLKTVAVSALVGSGIPEFFEMLDKAKQEYETDYRPQYERLLKEKQAASIAEQTKQLERVKLDLKQDKAAAQHGDGGMFTSSDLLAGMRFHIGGAQAEDNEDETRAREQEAEDDEAEQRELQEFREFLKKDVEKKSDS